jgi:hypothetical protein
MYVLLQISVSLAYITLHCKVIFAGTPLFSLCTTVYLVWRKIHFWYSSKLNTKYELIYLQNLTGTEYAPSKNTKKTYVSIPNENIVSRFTEVHNTVY